MGSPSKGPTPIPVLPLWQMRITAELVEKSASFINAVRDRELDLRGTAVRLLAWC